MRISDWSSDVCSSDLVCATREEKGMSGIPQTGSVLEQFVRWESAFADRTYMTQPGTDGSITNYSWGEVADQARRMAAHQIGRASCRQRVCQYVYISVVAVPLQKKY